MSRKPSPYPDGPDEADLWFLPGPVEDDDAPPLPRAEVEGGVVAGWSRAEAANARALARLAQRFGALDDRLARGPAGWRQRLALMEAAELGWLAGDRIGADRLALWLALRLGGVQADAQALGRVAWAVRRLTGGPGPEAGLAAFLGRQEAGGEEGLADRAGGWAGAMAQAGALHPFTRAALGFHLWSLAGLDRGPGAQLEAAVTAARIAAAEGAGAVFLPLGLGGGGGLRAAGDPEARLRRWYAGAEAATLAALRQIEAVEGWRARAGAAASGLSGRTPPLLLDALADWPLLSAPMAGEITGASRAAVQRNLAWFEARGLIREVTGQGRYRFWAALV
ncbi:MAG: hypothetical protein WCZ72_01705 [Gemmobacter sp.]